MLNRGLYPVVIQDVQTTDIQKRTTQAIETAKELGWVSPGDHVVITCSDMDGPSSVVGGDPSLGVGTPLKDVLMTSVAVVK